MQHNRQRGFIQTATVTARQTQSHPTVTHIHTHTHPVCVCVRICVSWAVSWCFLAGGWWGSAHGERRGHPDKAWRRKNGERGEFLVSGWWSSFTPSMIQTWKCVLLVNRCLMKDGQCADFLSPFTVTFSQKIPIILSGVHKFNQHLCRLDHTQIKTHNMDDSVWATWDEILCRWY